MKEHRAQDGETSRHSPEGTSARIPGRSTLTSSLEPAAPSAPAPVSRLQLKLAAPSAMSAQSFIDAIASSAVQLKSTPSAASPEQVHQAAAAGIQGAGESLPHLDKIQASFGPQHDMSGVVAHVGGPAGNAAGSIGASAYATGNHVAFAQAPDLHTAAHEAAHVVQQQQGVQLYGGIGASGDAYEQHADAVADRVIAGESAADLLGASASSAGHGAAVQKKDGKVTYSGTAGSGKVTARENDLDPSDRTNTNYSLEYAGADADKAHWLQFVNFTMWADEPTGKVYYTGSVDTSSGNKPFSTDKVTNWSVDGGSSSDPYYEATGSNVRDPKKSTKIFDMPGGASIESFAAKLVKDKAPKATKVTFVAAFDTYLVVDNKSIHHVVWSATTEYDPAKKTSAAISYGTGAAGAVVGLPKNLKKVLDTEHAGNKIT